MIILYSDENIVVVVKPYGILSALDKKENMVTALESEIGGEIFPVHRLDKTTAGVMVYARNKQTAANLSKQITEGNFKKTYRALIEGKITPESGRLEDLLFFDKGRNKSYVVKRERKGVKKAVLNYKTLETVNNISLVEVELVTGRTHQIRVQFSSRKHPLLGDRRYGSSQSFTDLGLFSTEVSFLSPESNQMLNFSFVPFGSAFEYFNKNKNTK